MNNKFSILTSAHNRSDKLMKLIMSIRRQDFDDYEIIVIDDGSTDGLGEKLHLLKNCGIRVFRNEERQERVISLNRAIKEATGDWLMTIDSDDEMFPRFLSLLNLHIESDIDMRLCNYGWLSIWKDHVTLRQGENFKPYEHFDTGLVASGSFAWHRSLSDCINMPHVKDCYSFADVSGIPGYNSKVRTLGNPWGQDYYMFWRLTRQNVSKRLPIIGTIVNIR